MKRMRSVLWTNLLAAATLAAAAPEPVVAPFEALDRAPSILVKVGGRERRIVLTTASPNSYLKGAPAEPVEIEVGGRVLGRVRMREPSEGQIVLDKVEGGIGMDLLKGMAVGVDEYRREVTIWPKGSLPPADAEAWVSALPPWGGPVRVRRLKTGALPTGSPSLEATVAGKRVPVLVRLGFNGSVLAPTVGESGAPVGRSFALTSDLSLPGAPRSWFLYEPGGGDSIDPAVFGASSAISQDSLDSRRVLMDLAGDALYFEELPKNARLAYFLSRFTKVSLAVREGGIFVQLPPGSDGSLEPEMVAFAGCQVLRMADVRAGEWLAALRDEDGAKRLASLLARLLREFKIDVLTLDGRELSITVLGG